MRNHCSRNRNINLARKEKAQLALGSYHTYILDFFTMTEILAVSTEKVNAGFDNPHLAGLLKMAVTADHVRSITEAKFAWRRLFVEGHMIAIAAKSNAGKTAIAMKAAAEMSGSGYTVLYVNADASASGIREHHSHAQDSGYKLVNPDITKGSAQGITNELRRLARSGEALSQTVVILDTLKKFADLMSKSDAKDFNMVLRSLTAKGMTVIVLSHTNKYEDNDGNPIHEGVGDLRNDFDELIYLIPVTNEDQTITVSTKINKCRAELKNETFLIDVDREVKVLPQFVDTAEKARQQKHLDADREVIEFITQNLRTASCSVTSLHDTSKIEEVGFSRKRIEVVVIRYCEGQCDEPLWRSKPAATNGTIYELIMKNSQPVLSGE